MQGKGTSRWQSLEKQKKPKLNRFQLHVEELCKTRNVSITEFLYREPNDGKKLNFPKNVSKEILVWGQKSKWNLTETGSTENKELKRR